MSRTLWRSGVFISIVLCLGLCGKGQAQTLIINEFMASNDSTIQDPQGGYEDWVEIYNTGSETLDLAGFFLTDEINNRTKWQFPSGSPELTTIRPQGFLLVWLDDDTNDDGLHAGFKLAAGGETIALVDNDSTTLLNLVQFPAQTDDISFGRFPDGANAWQFMATPTPGAANQEGYSGEVEAVDISVEHGIFTEPLTITLSTPTPEATIYYTLDGAEPYPVADPTAAGNVYDGSLTINETTCLRAKAIRPGWKESPISTRTYLFLKDVITQSETGERPSPRWPAPTRAVNVQAMDYGMDPDVTGDPAYAPMMTDALLALPTISLVTDYRHLFDDTDGIYTHPLKDGRAWERPVSVEWINPDGSDGFQVDAGIRIRGGTGRRTDNPKHGFRLFFRSDYGPARLEYPLFGTEGAEKFNEIDLRTAQGFSWHLNSENARHATWLYNVWSMDTQRALGQPYSRSRFVHLYLNGQYWGLYQAHERPEASYAASYYGGKERDYDVIKSSPTSGKLSTLDGNLDAYEDLWTAVNEDLSDPNAYLALQGLLPDGSADPDGTKLLDVDNLIDYMLLVFFSGNRDAPIGKPGLDNHVRNLMAFFNDDNPDGFQFVSHEAEHTLGAYLPEGVDLNRVAVTLKPTLQAQENCNPWWIHLRLMQDSEAYYLSFVDRAFALLSHEGGLTPQAASARLLDRAEEIRVAVVAESARWGDYLTPDQARTRDADWLVSVDRIVNDYFQASPVTRTDVVLGQLQDQGWYSAVAAPAFNQRGGDVPVGFEVSLSASAGSIFYSADGTDPRFGAEYTEPLTLAHSTAIKSRAFDADQWSPLNEAIFVVGPIADSLRISELMYHGRNNANPPEYLEFTNIGAETLNLNLVALTIGVEFTFPAIELASGGYVVITESVDEFTAYYPNFSGLLAGQYQGRLSNAGERLKLDTPAGTTILDFAYDDEWYAITDGEGYSLTIVDPAIDPGQLGEKSSWTPSPFSDGTPGQ